VQEVRYAGEVREWDVRIHQCTDELLQLTRQNTQCINAVSDITLKQKQLEAAMSSTQKGVMAGDPLEQRQQEVAERDGLVKLVNAQALHIEELKKQIGALRKKTISGGL
jgi:cilia- and flagella-associated protein 44